MALTALWCWFNIVHRDMDHFHLRLKTMTDIIRDLICGAAEVAALLLSAAVTCLAAAYAFIWAGPIAGFVVFVIVASLSISAISYFTY